MQSENTTTHNCCSGARFPAANDMMFATPGYAEGVDPSAAVAGRLVPTTHQAAVLFADEAFNAF